MELRDITVAAFQRAKEEGGGLVNAFKYTVEGCNTVEEIVLSIFVIGMSIQQEKDATSGIRGLLDLLRGRKPE